MAEVTIPSSSENPLAPITPPVVSETMEATAETGAASLDAMQALLTLHREELNQQLARLNESVGALPAAITSAIRAELAAAETVAETLPQVAGGTDSENGQTTLEVEPAPTVTIRRRKRGLFR